MGLLVTDAKYLRIMRRKYISKLVRSNLAYIIIIAVVYYLMHAKKDILPAIKEYNS
jgi:hypothetical protein